MSIGKVIAEAMSEHGVPLEGEPQEETGATLSPERRAIALPPRVREELKSLLRLQNETQERMRLVLATLEEALDVPAGWVIRDVDEGFVEVNVYSS